MEWRWLPGWRVRLGCGLGGEPWCVDVLDEVKTEVGTDRPMERLVDGGCSALALLLLLLLGGGGGGGVVGGIEQRHGNCMAERRSAMRGTAGASC